MYDELCRGLVRNNENLIIPWLLMSSYTYYALDKPLISDGLYDEMMQTLKDKWESIEHTHKSLIDREGLESGSLFDIGEEAFPTIIKSAAKRLLQEKEPPKKRRRRK